MFHMYDKKFISVTSMIFTPSPCHKLSHLLRPLPLERDVIYERPPSESSTNVGFRSINTWELDQ